MSIKRFSAFPHILRRPEGDPPSGGGAGDPPSGGGAGDPPPSILRDDFSFTEGWQDRLGDDAKGLTFKSLPDTIKSYKAATAKITELSQKVKELGGAEPTPIPADTAGYIAEIKLPEPTAMPEGVVVPEGLLKAAAEYGIANKIPPSITQKFVEFQIQQAGVEAAAMKDSEFQQLNAAKAEISKLVGKENYETTIGNAKAAHDLLGLRLDEADLIRNPNLVISLAKIHKSLSPGALKDLNLTAEGQSAAGKLQQAEDIVGNKDNPDYEAFHDSSHINHDNVMAKYNRLIAEHLGAR